MQEVIGKYQALDSWQPGITVSNKDRVCGDTKLGCGPDPAWDTK